MIRVLKRPLWVLAAIGALLIIVSVVLLLWFTSQQIALVAPIRVHTHVLAQMEHAVGQARGLQVDVLEDDASPVSSAALSDFRSALAGLAGGHDFLGPDSRDLVRRASDHAQRFSPAPGAGDYHLEESAFLLRSALQDEVTAHNALVLETFASVERAHRTALVIAVGIIVIVVLVMVALKQRVIDPLNNLGWLMTLLGRRDYTSAPTHGVDPVVRPLIDNYNAMLDRLMELEREHAARESELSDAVRRATRLLMHQHRRVARAERLGAVGELAATVAHELRNPLASIDIALRNLREDLSEDDHVERIDLVRVEVQRMARQLNTMLAEARHQPEDPVRIDLQAELKSIADLLRYQVNEDIDLRVDAPADLACTAPESRLRQVLLNLLLNAAQAIGERSGRILVTARSVDNGVEFVVEDDGPGFPQALLEDGERNFRSFRAGGTGLGLALTRRFITDMGGRMELGNRNDGGAWVRLFIPSVCDSGL